MLKDIETDDVLRVAWLPENTVDRVGELRGAVAVRVQEAKAAPVGERVVLKEGRFSDAGLADYVFVHACSTRGPSRAACRVVATVLSVAGSEVRTNELSASIVP
jgi:hypothetical protein